MTHEPCERTPARALLLCSLLLGASLSSGCAVPMSGLPPSYVANPQAMRLSPITIVQNSSGPASYHSPTLHDAPERPTELWTVVGEACQSGFELPWAYSRTVLGRISAGWGDGGYAEAMRRAQAKAPPGSSLYDVRADLRQTSVLRIWRQLCVVVTASAAARPHAPPPHTPAAIDKDDSTYGQTRL